MVISLLYSRAADAAKVVQNTHAVCVCELPWLDWAALAITFLYSILTIVLKEAGADWSGSVYGLGSLAVLFLIHAGLTILAFATGDLAGVRSGPMGGRFGYANV